MKNSYRIITEDTIPSTMMQFNKLGISMYSCTNSIITNWDRLQWSHIWVFECSEEELLILKLSTDFIIC